MRTLFGNGRAPLVVRDALVQDFPHEATEPVGNGADGLRVSQAHDQSTIHQLEDAALGLDGSIRRLIEESAPVPIAMG